MVTGHVTITSWHFPIALLQASQRVAPCERQKRTPEEPKRQQFIHRNDNDRESSFSAIPSVATAIVGKRGTGAGRFKRVVSLSFEGGLTAKLAVVQSSFQLVIELLRTALLSQPAATFLDSVPPGTRGRIKKLRSVCVEGARQGCARK